MTPIQPHASHCPTVARSAFSLAEVLIAMGILTIGLLGVAAVFPVGGHYMQSGEIADRASAVAQAALEDAIIRGHLDPENWTLINFDPNVIGAVQAKPYRFIEGLRTALSVPQADLDAASITREYYLGVFYGGAYVIDPLGFATSVDESQSGYSGTPPFSNRMSSEPIRRFPGSKGLVFGTGTHALWAPWNADSGVFGGIADTWPVRRVISTVEPTAVGGLRDPAQSSRAAALFTTSDDLALALPTNGDEPARQRIESLTSGSSTVASARQARGEYSWLLTVAPSSDAARNAFATRPDAYPVDVSAAVFYKRNVGRGAEAVTEAERLVTAQVVSTSPGGGEMLLTKIDTLESSPFEDLRGGHYVLVVGPHPQSTSSNPRLVLRWCRILNLEGTGNANQVLVSLRGPDWPWQPSNASNSISNDLRVAIVPGVVAVHTKTMRLGADEGLEWAID